MRAKLWGLVLGALVMLVTAIDAAHWSPQYATGQVLQVVDRRAQVQLAGEPERVWWAELPGRSVCAPGDAAQVRVLTSAVTGWVVSVESADCGRDELRRKGEK